MKTELLDIFFSSLTRNDLSIAIGVHICEHGSEWMDCQGSWQKQLEKQEAQRLGFDSS